MKGLPRRFWEDKSNEMLKEWYNRKCNPGSREYLKLSAKAEQASAIQQVLETMDTALKEADGLPDRMFTMMSINCKWHDVGKDPNATECRYYGTEMSRRCERKICPIMIQVKGGTGIDGQ